MPVTENSRGIAAMMLAMAGFILNDTLVKLVSDHLPLGQIIFVRGLIATLQLMAICYMAGVFSQLGKLRHRAVVWRTMGEMAATIFYLSALFQLPIANVTAILQVAPLMVTAAAAVVFRETVGWRRWAAVLVGFAGVMIIVRPGLDGFNAWSFVALAGVAFVAVRDLSTRQLPKATPTLLVALLTTVCITTLGGGLVAVGGWQPMTVNDLTYLLFASIFIVVGYIFIIAAMRTGEIVVVAPFRYSIVVWAIVIGYLVWGDLPDAMTLLGTAIVVLTGFYAFLREQKLKARPTRSQEQA